MHPIFVRSGVFFTFLKKKCKMNPSVVLLGTFSKTNNLKNIYIFRPADLNIQKFHLRVTQQFSFVALKWPIKKKKIVTLVIPS